MAIIKPFRGVRPPKMLVESIASRPYDVLDSEEARMEAGDNEKSLYHIIKPEINFESTIDESDPRAYDSAIEHFQKFQDKGWLVQDDKDCYYIYAQTMNGKTQYGLVVGAYVDDYLNGNIKKHELQSMILLHLTMDSVTSFGLLVIKLTSIRLLKNLRRCQAFISQTDIIVQLLQP